MTNEINFLATKVFYDVWNAIQSKLYKLIVQEGSSRSSKTWSDFQVIFLYLYENPLTTCTILRDTQKSCREIVETDFVKWLSDPMGRKSELERNIITIKEFDAYIKTENLLRFFIRNKTNHTWTFKHNNSFIRFTGLDDENDAMGMTQDICWINEPYNFSHEVYKQLAQRTSKYILFDWNPKQNHWIEDEKKKNNTITLVSTFLDNPFCPKESKIQIQSYQPISQCEIVLNNLLNYQEAVLYDTDFNDINFTKRQINELKRCIYNQSVNSDSLYHWLVFGKGLKSEKPNKVYKNWQIITDKEFNQLPYSKYYALDFGTTNPSALVEVKFDGEKSFFCKEKLYLPISKMSSTLSEVLESLGIDKKIPLICDSADPIKISDLILNGFNAIPAVKGPGSVKAGIDFIMAKLIYVTSLSENILFEYDNYEWEIVNNVNLDRPIKKDDHILDAIRYIITYLQFYLSIK